MIRYWKTSASRPGTGGTPCETTLGASRTTGRCLGGVIFDMDGVVIDSGPPSVATLGEIVTEIISEHGGSADPALLAGLAGVNLAEVLEVAAAHSGRTLDTEALYRS